eukprot:gnl/TRDRNA2_/TRDRNA2_126404_c0_seq2.p1 gnl/TRDRNA2_/TRDRNA2_126404_c0~~gnl/TRDRNA2_/TRDRNA2_126404_c0_seq2.p1  ORF type:complete len:280 (+),score=24.53 gnl/TRDRNA2_/TRDRNA2_126404_c0_seq2:101-940(+)
MYQLRWADLPDHVWVCSSSSGLYKAPGRWCQRGSAPASFFAHDIEIHADSVSGGLCEPIWSWRQRGRATTQDVNIHADPTSFFNPASLKKGFDKASKKFDAGAGAASAVAGIAGDLQGGAEEESAGISKLAMPDANAGPPNEMADASVLWGRHSSWSSSRAARSAAYAAQQAEVAQALARRASVQVGYLMEHPCLRGEIREIPNELSTAGAAPQPPTMLPQAGQGPAMPQMPPMPSAPQMPFAALQLQQHAMILSPDIAALSEAALRWHSTQHRSASFL